MDPVTGLSLGRVAVGAVALADPARAAQMLQLDPATSPQVPYVTRLFGSREIALGLATLLASGATRRNLVLLGIFVDAADAATAVLATQEKQVSSKAGASMAVPAAGAVVSGLLGLRRGRRSRAA